MSDVDRYWTEPERLSDFAQLVEVVATAFCQRLRGEVRGGRLTVRKAARLLGWSSPSKVGRLVAMDTQEIKVPIRWAARGRGVPWTGRASELPGQTSIDVEG